jgi:hypothetical protein
MTGRKTNPSLLAGALALAAVIPGAAISAQNSGDAEALRAALDDEYKASYNFV